MTSYCFDQYSTDGVKDRVQTNLKDNATEKIYVIRKLNHTNVIFCDRKFAHKRRVLASVQDHNSVFNFELNENYHNQKNESFLLCKNTAASTFGFDNTTSDLTDNAAVEDYSGNNNDFFD